MKRTILVFSIAVLMSASLQAIAEDRRFDENLYGYNDLCFGETLKIGHKEAVDLKTVNCQRALRERGMTRHQLSSTYHNLGLLLMAKSQLSAALKNFQQSVALSDTVDKRNVEIGRAHV